MSELKKTNNRPSLFGSWPFGESLFQDFFGKDWNNFPSSMISQAPSVNIKDREKDFLIEAAVPGFKKEDFDVSVDNQVLTISASSKNEEEQKEENYTRREFNYSSFRRSFQLPENIVLDGIDGKYEDGVLQVVLPKKKVKSEKESNRINIK